MNEKEEQNFGTDGKTFREFYHLKEELRDFCKKNNLQTTGSKEELTERIALFLDTGERSRKNHGKKSANAQNITPDSIIEENFVCSEKHRAFYVEQIGKSFKFNVGFQKWLKNNAGKTYKDSVAAYFQILADKKATKSAIEKQFEYNAYVRDFFSDNPKLTLDDAIKCWKHKKSLRGHNKYEKADLEALK